MATFMATSTLGVLTLSSYLLIQILIELMLHNRAHVDWMECKGNKELLEKSMFSIIVIIVGDGIDNLSSNPW